MVKTAVYGFWALLLLSCGPTEPTQVSGKSLYLKKCAICHGSDGSRGGSGSPDISKTLLSREEVSSIITEGQNVMPAFGSVLEAKEIDMIAEYVMQLSN